MANESWQKKVQIYAKTPEMKARWQKKADRKIMPLSKFLVHVIEESLNKSEQSEADHELKMELVATQEESKDLKREILRLNKLISVQEKELEELRSKAFLEPSFTGVRSFNQELIRLLRDARRPLSDDDIIIGMGLSYGESDSIKAISKQLDALREYGLLQYTAKGWRWAD